MWKLCGVDASPGRGFRAVPVRPNAIGRARAQERSRDVASRIAVEIHEPPARRAADAFDAGSGRKLLKDERTLARFGPHVGPQDGPPDLERWGWLYGRRHVCDRRRELTRCRLGTRGVFKDPTEPAPPTCQQDSEHDPRGDCDGASRDAGFLGRILRTAVRAGGTAGAHHVPAGKTGDDGALMLGAEGEGAERGSAPRASRGDAEGRMPAVRTLDEGHGRDTKL